jgi:hypothetical protein
VSKPSIAPPWIALVVAAVPWPIAGTTSVAFVSGMVVPSDSFPVVVPSHRLSSTHSLPSTLLNVWFSI